MKRDTGTRHGTGRGVWVILIAAGLLAGCETQRHTAAESDWAREARNEAFQEGANLPPTPRTLYTMAHILTGQAKDAEAAFVLGELIEEHPDFRPAYVALAEVHLRHRRPEDAARVLELGLTRSPNDAVMLNDLGMCALLMNDPARALDHFQAAAAAQPEDARYRSNIAVALGMLGRYDEALAAYEQVMPRGAAYYNVGVLCQANNDLARAVESFRKAEQAGYRYGATPPAAPDDQM